MKNGRVEKLMSPLKKGHLNSVQDWRVFVSSRISEKETPREIIITLDWNITEKPDIVK